MMSLMEQIASGIEQVRIRKPIVHH
ncbi:MAG: hypothetical protein H6Q76_1770, partial [Firmicutes bacterium]|nr:hypothetical protein [Bacillota bacterium]